MVGVYWYMWWYVLTYIWKQLTSSLNLGIFNRPNLVKRIWTQHSLDKTFTTRWSGCRVQVWVQAWVQAQQGGYYSLVKAVRPLPVTAWDSQLPTDVWILPLHWQGSWLSAAIQPEIKLWTGQALGTSTSTNTISSLHKLIKVCGLFTNRCIIVPEYWKFDAYMLPV